MRRWGLLVGLVLFIGQVRAQDSLFKSAVVCIKRYEGMHDSRHLPYVGYGHKLLPGESFPAMTESIADSLLRHLVEHRADHRQYLHRGARPQGQDRRSVLHVGRQHHRQQRQGVEEGLSRHRLAGGQAAQPHGRERHSGVDKDSLKRHFDMKSRPSDRPERAAFAFSGRPMSHGKLVIGRQLRLLNELTNHVGTVTHTGEVEDDSLFLPLRARHQQQQFRQSRRPLMPCPMVFQCVLAHHVFVRIYIARF